MKLRNAHILYGPKTTGHLPMITVVKYGNTKHCKNYKEEVGACLPWWQAQADINSVLFSMLQIASCGFEVEEIHEAFLEIDEYAEWHRVNTNNAEAY